MPQFHPLFLRLRTEEAQQRLQRWKEQFPFNKDDYFAQRLAMDELTEDSLLALLEKSPEALQARVSTIPLWLQALVEAFEVPESEKNTVVILPLPPTENGLNAAAYLATLRPLIKGCMTRLETGLQALSQKYLHLPFDPATIIPLLISIFHPVFSLDYLKRMCLNSMLHAYKGIYKVRHRKSALHISYNNYHSLRVFFPY